MRESDEIDKLRRDRDEAIGNRSELVADIENLFLVATTDEDADGFITAYHFKTGALHRLLAKARQPLRSQMPIVGRALEDERLTFAEYREQAVATVEGLRRERDEAQTEIKAAHECIDEAGGIPNHDPKIGELSLLQRVRMLAEDLGVFERQHERDRRRIAEFEAALHLEAPYPLTSVLSHLLDATVHMLKDHGCDTDRWEIWQSALVQGQKILDALYRTAPAQPAPSTGKHNESQIVFAQPATATKPTCKCGHQQHTGWRMGPPETVNTCTALGCGCLAFDAAPPSPAARKATCDVHGGRVLMDMSKARPCSCGEAACNGIDDSASHQCGGPTEACMTPGCRECGTPSGGISSTHKEDAMVAAYDKSSHEAMERVIEAARHFYKYAPLMPTSRHESNIQDLGKALTALDVALEGK